MDFNYQLVLTQIIDRINSIIDCNQLQLLINREFNYYSIVSSVINQS